MTAIPLLGPTPISVGGGTLNPEVNACFTCTPPYQHAREWKPDPNSPDRRRTLVLCFDGTGDSFDQDVGRFYLAFRPCLILNAVFTEFQRRPIPGDAEERRSHKATRLLSGDVPRSKIYAYNPSRSFCQAGIGTYTSNVLQTPIIQGTSKLLDQMVAWNLAEHIKGLSIPSCLTFPDKSF